jgi:RNA polymerase sigma factor (sigma-70 family)
MTGAPARAWPRFAPDDRLVALVRRGELTAFEVLYDRHARELLAFCSYILGSKHDAEDAVQSTFASAYRALIADERPVELRPWLFAIARNTSLSILRTRRPTSELHEIQAPGCDPVHRAEQRESLRALVVTMLELPERQRTALVLAELHGLSHREIGAVLDVPGERVKAYIYQARASLISERAARGADCAEIREELSSARGPALLKARLRRHVRSCEGCRDFAAELSRRRGMLGVLLPLPLAPTLALKRRVLDAASGNANGAGLGLGGSAVGASLAGTSAELVGAGVKALVTKVLVGVIGAASVAGVGVGVGAGAGGLALSAAATNGQGRGARVHVNGARAVADLRSSRDTGTPPQTAGPGYAAPVPRDVAPGADGRSREPARADRGARTGSGTVASGASRTGKSAEAAARGLGLGKSAETHGKSAETHGKSAETHGRSAESHGSAALHGASGEAHGNAASSGGTRGARGKSAGTPANGAATPHGQAAQPHGSATAQPIGVGAAGREAPVAKAKSPRAGGESHANGSSEPQKPGSAAPPGPSLPSPPPPSPAPSPSPAAKSHEAAAGPAGGKGAAPARSDAAPSGHAQKP